MAKAKEKDSTQDVLKDVMQGLNAEFKDSDFSFASKSNYVSNLKWVSSGVYAINYVLSGNPFKGLPFGKTVSLIGDSGSGKSLLSQHILRETQKIGGISVLFDVERGVELSQLEKIGIDPTKLVISKAKMLEDIFEKAIYFIKSIKEKAPEMPLTIVIDSISMASSRSEMEEGFDKVDMKRAKLIRQGLRMINTLVSDENVCFIIINHQTSNIGVMYGPAKVTTGGTAVEYVPSIVIEVSKHKMIREGDERDGKPVGLNVSIAVKKTRIHIPFVRANVEIKFDSGFDPMAGIFSVMENSGLVKKVSAAGWYAFADDLEKKYRETEILDLIKQNPEQYLKKLDKQIIVSAAEIVAPEE